MSSIVITLPQSSILIGFSIINHPFWGTTIFGNTHILPPVFFEVSCCKASFQWELWPLLLLRQAHRCIWRAQETRPSQSSTWVADLVKVRRLEDLRFDISHMQYGCVCRCMKNIQEHTKNEQKPHIHIIQYDSFGQKTGFVAYVVVFLCNWSLGVQPLVCLCRIKWWSLSRTSEDAQPLPHSTGKPRRWNLTSAWRSSCIGWT